MTSPVTCLVTLHGVGFMTAPQPDLSNSGYADLLHSHLSKCLGTLLSDDPNRAREQRGDNGAIYVESRWLTPGGNASREEGLKRLGAWSEDKQHIETAQAPLVANDEPISHVALVYSDLEPQVAELGAGTIATVMSLFSARHYAHVAGLLHMAMTDIHAMFGHHGSAASQQSVSLFPRKSLGFRPPRHMGITAPPPATSMPNPGLLAALRSLEDDVACYICHNEERERVRSFVNESLLRLAYRDDVGAIVFNTHSNGTVIGLDIIRQLPPFAAAKIKAFVTAGSPLRKYVDLFHWGQQIESINPIQPWYNFWDELDPVADPLEPPMTWRRGEKLTSPYDPKLFALVDPNSGVTSNIDVADIQVDNVHKSVGGGLQAHNYWDNEEQFVSQLADIVRATVPQQSIQAA